MDRSERRKQLLDVERAVPTSRVARLFRTGKNAGAMARAVLSRHDVELADVMRIVEGLGELKGVAMKAGQILGYIDPTLPTELREALSLLQTASAASPWKDTELTVREALGTRAERLLAGMERTPLAVASIGQVHRAHLRDESGASETDVVVKVRHRGIVRALTADFSTAGVGSSFASLVMPSAGAAVREMVAEARTAMLEECDFALEADRQELFGRLYASHPVLSIPAVVRPWCGAGVLTTAFAPGRTLDELLVTSPPAAVRDRFGAALFELYIGTLYRWGVFHADPHPGNYAFTEDGRVVVYDFGCVRRFDRETVDALSALLGAVRADDRGAIHGAMGALGATPPGDDAGHEHLRALLRGFFAPLLRPGPHPIEAGAAVEANAVLRDKRALMKLALPGKLLFLFRIRFGLYAVLARLGATADWASLESAYAADRRGIP